MFKKIMVCLDGSPLAAQILPYAADEVVYHKGQLILFRVSAEPFLPSLAIPGSPSVPIEIAAMEKAAQEDETKALTYLEAVAADLAKQQGINAECVVIPGNPGEAIVSYALSSDVDLIAIATHGRSGLGKAFFGSVADYVLKKSGHPILLVKPS